MMFKALYNGRENICDNMFWITANMVISTNKNEKDEIFEYFTELLCGHY